jgi:uncharacterized protein (TIGR02246 family)
MRKATGALIALIWLAICATAIAATDTPDEVRALYQRFVTAQNARDLNAVGAQFIDTDDFLWVSDGQSFWGRKATLERMAGFQQAEIWRVEPDLKTARVVDVTAGSAYLHLTLDLVIGPATKPDRIRFLVSALCVRTIQGWKIAALFTTTAKPT